jgi:UDP-N-acetylglucosamine--N-acetylmuramyl-(pentapeptide) pyrophosphoryl-undecaprenol N-acetylglucosamine transferase
MEMKPLESRDAACAIAMPADFFPPTGRLRICLAGSGGGHLRQLLDLERVWSNHDYFIVSEESALSRSLAQDHPVHTVAHFALGQAKLGDPWKMLISGLRNFWQSAKIAFRERPDIVITTGAGSVLFTILWARLLGARFILIESFARFDKPSLFSRMAAPFAHHKIVQSSALAAAFNDAQVFDPLEILDTPRRRKKPLVFVTVGATLPFDRMVRAVSILKARGEIPEDVVIQTGIGGYAPKGIETFETLPFDRMLSYMREADIVVCHGGTGSLITALREGCRTVVMPRQFKHGDHYDNHQDEITRAFSGRGLVTTANSVDELAEALKIARAREPVCATTNHARLTNFLRGILAQYSEKLARRA